MPKGRIHVPSTAVDGIWFRHRGLPDSGPIHRDVSTCTGRMLCAPFQESTSGYPPRPPPLYTEKDAKNFKVVNNFSKHDNRHSFQDHGVYFGDGRSTRDLGKNLVESDQRQHYTDKHYLKHNGREVTHHDYNPIKATDYRGLPTAEPPRHRRFARHHAEGSPGAARLTTTTTQWAETGGPEPAYRTPLHVLAVTQEPMLPANTWKYSNHGLAKCYPSYNHVRHRDDPYTVWKLDAPNVAAANARLKAAATSFKV